MIPLFQAGLNNDIRNANVVALKQSSNVRWLSPAHLLESIVRSFNALKKIQQLKKKQFTIDFDIVDGLIRLLLPPKNILIFIQANRVPSLHTVVISVFALRKSLDSFANLIAYEEEHGSTSVQRRLNRSTLMPQDRDDEVENEGNSSFLQISGETSFAYKPPFLPSSTY